MEVMKPKMIEDISPASHLQDGFEASSEVQNFASTIISELELLSEDSLINAVHTEGQNVILAENNGYSEERALQFELKMLRKHASRPQTVNSVTKTIARAMVSRDATMVLSPSSMVSGSYAVENTENWDVQSNLLRILSVAAINLLESASTKIKVINSLSSGWIQEYSGERFMDRELTDKTRRDWQEFGNFRTAATALIVRISRVVDTLHRLCTAPAKTNDDIEARSATAITKLDKTFVLDLVRICTAFVVKLPDTVFPYQTHLAEGICRGILVSLNAGETELGCTRTPPDDPSSLYVSSKRDIRVPIASLLFFMLPTLKEHFIPLSRKRSWPTDSKDIFKLGLCWCLYSLMNERTLKRIANVEGPRWWSSDVGSSGSAGTADETNSGPNILRNSKDNGAAENERTQSALGEDPTVNNVQYVALSTSMRLLLPLLSSLEVSLQRVATFTLSKVIETVAASEVRWFEVVLYDELCAVLVASSDAALSALSTHALFQFLVQLGDEQRDKRVAEVLLKVLDIIQLTHDRELRRSLLTGLKDFVILAGYPYSMTIFRYTQRIYSVVLPLLDTTDKETALVLLEVLAALLTATCVNGDSYRAEIFVAVMKLMVTHIRFESIIRPSSRVASESEINYESGDAFSDGETCDVLGFGDTFYDTEIVVAALTVCELLAKVTKDGWMEEMLVAIENDVMELRVFVCLVRERCSTRSNVSGEQPKKDKE